MRFNEKLIELRKKGGLSQEDLGYQFNVTKETISKWELGQTTPEIDKLEEISRFFNVRIDELIDGQGVSYGNDFISGNVIVEDKKGWEADKKKKARRMVVFFVILLVICLFFTIHKNVNKIIKNSDGKIFEIFESFNEEQKDVNNQASSIFDIATNVISQILHGFEKTDNEINNNFKENQENFDKTQNLIDKTKNEIEIKSFNGTFELYEGIIKGVQVKSLLSEIMTNNRKETKIITVIYENKDVTDAEQIKSVITQLDAFEDYDSYFRYDDDGYIYEVNISKL